MQDRKRAKKRLPCSTESRTVVQGSDEVDATTKRLLESLRDLEMQRWQLGRDIEAIQRSLTLAGVKPPAETESLEAHYRAREPFKEMRLTDACLKVLRDHPEQWFTKAQVEYLLVRGGCPFSTDNIRNSVDVTMRRLADQGMCMAERAMGSRGNRYRFAEKAEKRGNELENPGTTKK